MTREQDKTHADALINAEVQTDSGENKTMKTANPRLLESKPFKIRVEMVNEGIEKALSIESEHSALLYESAAHLLRAGGKRLRPLLLILSCEAVGGRREIALPYAVAAELIQTASLIHDDIIDQSDTRRGVVTVHKKYGLRMAILSADLLVAIAFKMVSEQGRADVILHLGKCGISMVEGEATDFMIDIERFRMDSQAQYFKMIERKTVSFIKEVTEVGAIVGGGTENEIAQLGKYGELIGFAFQIRDDILDLTATQSGKDAFIDVVRRRYNYPLVLALEAVSKEEREAIFKSIDGKEIDKVIELLKRTDALERANETAVEYVTKAKKVIESGDFQNKDLLFAIADFVVSRDH